MTASALDPKAKKATTGTKATVPAMDQRVAQRRRSARVRPACEAGSHHVPSSAPPNSANTRVSVP
jgi:hypothetical protein